MLIAVKLIALFIVAGTAKVTTVEKCRVFQNRMLTCLRATGDDLPKTKQPKIEWVLFSNSNVPVVKKSHLANFPDLTDFHAEKCNVESIEPKAFHGMATLEWVDLSSNNLKTIDPDMFENCPKIHHFNISDNRQLTIPKDASILNAPKLKWLDLNLINLQELYPKSFQNLPNLNYLSLSGNKLTTLPNGVFEPLKNLNSLDLSKNQFKSMSVDPFKNLGSIILRLEGNPWKCDYELAPFMKWAKTNIIKDDVRCTTCENGDKSWKDITTVNCSTSVL